MMDVTDIHALSLELLERILYFLNPLSHLDFALTDRHLHFCLSNVLKHHQECHRLYHKVSDWRAETLARTLRAVATDHIDYIAAWHLRTLGGFYSSTEYEENPIDEAHAGELVKFVKAKMIANDIPAFGLRRMRRGDQEALQLALLALCPQLETLHSIRFYPPVGPPQLESDSSEGPHLGIDDESSRLEYDDLEDGQEHIMDQRHNLLGNYIRTIQLVSPQPIWPPGFVSLRKVIICPQEAEQLYMTATNIAPILGLPNINSVYLRGLYSDDNDHFDQSLLPIKSSSVEHFFFEDASPEDVKRAISGFVECAIALKSFIVKDGEINDFDLIIDTLSREHGSTLETCIYSDEEGHLSGYRCSKFLPDDIDVSRFTAMRVFMIDIEDVKLNSMRGSDDGSQDGLSGNVGSRKDFIKQFALSIPPNVRVMLFRGDDYANERDLEAIVAALEAMVGGDEADDIDELDEVDQEDGADEVGGVGGSHVMEETDEVSGVNGMEVMDGTGGVDNVHKMDEARVMDRLDETDETDGDAEDAEDDQRVEDGSHANLETVYLDEVYHFAMEYRQRHGCEESDCERAATGPCTHEWRAGKEWGISVIQWGERNNIKVVLERGATLRCIEELCDAWPGV